MQTLAEVERVERFLTGLHQLRDLKRRSISKATRWIWYYGWRTGYLDGVARSAKILRDERREQRDAQRQQVY